MYGSASEINLTGIYELSNNTYGNIIIKYICWILNNAREKNIKRLYFLARDGFVLCKVAKILCKRLELDIDCRYLYCSRQSLRIPAFHLMGDGIYEYIFMKAENLTANVIMSRTGLTESQINGIYNSIGFDPSRGNESLSASNYNELCTSLKECDRFYTLVCEISKKAYDAAIGYFDQEGILEQNHVAIVDSGWCGTMQRVLHILLDSAGFHGKLTGFYFGLYSYPGDKEYGDFVPFYFHPKGDTLNKILFSNNLFECMLSAPHGMTTGYQFDGGVYKPILGYYNIELDKMITDQINGICALAQDIAISELDIKNIAALKKECKKYVSDVMVKPDRYTVAVLGSFKFCDDCGDTYSEFLADNSQLELLKNYLIIPRIIKKLFKIKYKYKGIYWVYGVIALLPKWKQRWYRLNVYTWEWLRCKKEIVKQMKKG